MSKKLLGYIIGGTILLATIVGLLIANSKTDAKITYTEQAPVELIDGLSDVERGQGEVKIDGEEIKTVESVESDGPVTDVNNANCPEGEECGRGATIPDIDISTPQAFINSIINQCIDVDGFYGAQCWDSEAAFWLKYTGRTLSTCGTGAAKGTIADGCWQQNAGDEFDMIWDVTKIQPGDKAVFNTGTWGHIGTVAGYYNNGYFTLAGQNQGGRSCPGGGAAGNIINISARDFIGAFRPKIYVQPEPTPEPEPTPPQPSPEPAPAPSNEEDEFIYVVVPKDTLGAILIAYGYRGNRLFGDDGLAQKVAEENGIQNRGLIYPNQTIAIRKALLYEF